jgi:hypothetical protein
MRTIWLVLSFLLSSSPVLANSHAVDDDAGDESETAEDDDSGDSEEGAGESETGDDEPAASDEDPVPDEAAGESGAAADEDAAAGEATEGSAEAVAPEAAAVAPEAAEEEDEEDPWEDEDDSDDEAAAAEAADATDKGAELPAWLTSPEPVLLKLPGDLTIRPVARVQARVTVFDEDDAERNDPVVYGDPGLREGVSLRRVRLGVRADWKGLLGLSVVGGFDNRYDYTEPFGGGFKLTEATFSLTPLEEVGVSVGLDRVPFGRQAMISSAALALAERSIASEHMAPAREAGVFLGGTFGPEDNKVLGDNAVHWAFGISNGGGDWTGDADPSPRLATRVSLDLGAPWQEVESAWSPGGFGLSVGGSLSHNWGLEADSLLAGVDLGIRCGRIGLQGEFMVSNATPTFDTEGIPAILAERTSMGGYGQVVFAILPGTLEAVVRVGGYDDNTALEDAGDRLDVAGGVNFFLVGGRLKAQLDFVHRIELVESYTTSNDSLILQLQARL